MFYKEACHRTNHVLSLNSFLYRIYTPLLNHGCMLIPWLLQSPIPCIPGSCHLWLEGLQEPPLLEIPSYIAGMAGCLFPLTYCKHVGKKKRQQASIKNIYIYIYKCLRCFIYVYDIYSINMHILLYMSYV